MEGFRSIFQGVDDPRESSAKKRGLTDMLATLPGWSSCRSFARYARGKWEFLSQFLELKSGPPSLSVNKTRSALQSASRSSATARPETPLNPTVCESAVEVPNPGGRIGTRSSESLSSGLRGRSSCRGCSATEP